MTERKDKLSSAQLWQTLSEPEKMACVYFAVYDSGTGVGKTSMDIDDKSLEELTRRGVIENKPKWQMFQGFADGLRDRVSAIKSKMYGDPSAGLKDNERIILQDFNEFQNEADKKDTEPWYHLTNQEFLNYVKKQELG